MAKKKVSKKGGSRKKVTVKGWSATQSDPRDLSAGVIVVLSGGGFDKMNPKEVRERMDQYITDVNADPFVQANTGGNGLTFKLLPNQQDKHLHRHRHLNVARRSRHVDLYRCRRRNRGTCQ